MSLVIDSALYQSVQALASSGMTQSALQVCVHQSLVPEKSWVNDVGSIGRRQEVHSRAHVRAIHLRQKLIHNPAEMRALPI